MTVSYLPRGHAQLVPWLNHLAVRLPVQATALGISAAQIASVTADAAMVQHLVNDRLPALHANQKEETAYRTSILDGPSGAAPVNPPASLALPVAPASVPTGVLARVQALVAQIKAAPGYTEGIGKDLGVVAAFSVESTAKPTFKAIPQPGSQVELKWVKAGYDGVFIQSMHLGDAGWTDLGVDIRSPYPDARPPKTAGAAEVRQYRMRYLEADVQVGDWSDIVSATTTP